MRREMIGGAPRGLPACVAHAVAGSEHLLAGVDHHALTLERRQLRQQRFQSFTEHRSPRPERRRRVDTGAASPWESCSTRTKN